MTNEELVCRLQDERDHGEYELMLLQQNEGFIQKMSKPYQRAGVVMMDDLPGIGFLSLSSAISYWDREKGISFLTIWSMTLRDELQRIYNESRSVPVPNHINSEVASYVRLRNHFIFKLSRPPSIQETAENLGLNEKQATLIMQAAESSRSRSLDAPIAGTEGEDTELTLSDIIADDRNMMAECEKELDRLILSEILERELSKLDESERKVIHERFLGDTVKTVPEVATELHMKQNEARKLLQRGLKRLSRKSAVIRYHENENYYHATSIGHFILTQNSQPESYILRKDKQ